MDVAVEAAVPAAIDADLHLGIRRRSGAGESNYRRRSKLKKGTPPSRDFGDPQAHHASSPQIGPPSQGPRYAAHARTHRHDGTRTHDLWI